MLKYFVIIKKGEIVAPWIDFDDYNTFEGVTNDFSLKKYLLYFMGKIIILSSSDSKVSKARTEDLWSIRGNFIFFGWICWEKFEFKELGRPYESTLVKRGWTTCYFWLAHPKESIPWVDLYCCTGQRYRTVIFYSVPQRSIPWVDPYAEVDPMSQPPVTKTSITISFQLFLRAFNALLMISNGSIFSLDYL